MEAGMMKIVYSSILNGMRGDLSANKAKRTAPEVIKKEDCVKPETRYSLPNSDYNHFGGKSSQEVYISLINASSCANLQIKRFWTDI